MKTQGDTGSPGPAVREMVPGEQSLIIDYFHGADRYFDGFGLKSLFCEPRAANPGPNKTLARLGFTLEKTYDTIPGWINTHQTVNRWRMYRKNWPEVLTPVS